MSDKYREMLQKLLPPGPAWTRDLSSELKGLLQGLAVEPQRIEDRGLDLIEEIDPRTTTELLADWERVCGLPGDCSTPATEADRREVLHQLLLGHGDPNLTFWQDLVEAAGFTFNSIEEYRPFAAGDDAGDHCIGENWTFSWIISVGARTLLLNTIMQCMIDSLSPIHTVAEIHWQPYAYWVVRTADNSYTENFSAVFTDGDIRFIAVGDSGEIQYSEKGISWTHVAPGGGYSDDFKAGVSFGSGSAVAVGETAEIQRTLDNGDTWTSQAAGGGYGGDFYGAAYNSNVIVIVGTLAEAQTSADGAAWTSRSPLGANTFYCVAAMTTGDQTIIIAGGNADIQYSNDDGVTWNQATASESYAGTWRGATYANGHFWLVGTSGEIQQSVDGQSWRRIPNDSTGTWWDIVGDGEEGVLLVGSSKNLRGRTRIGSEMLFTTITAPAGSDDPKSIMTFSEYTVAVGDNALIWNTPQYGS